MPKKWTIEKLQEYGAEHPGFSFYTDQHPGIRLQGVQLLEYAGELDADQARHLRQQVAEFHSGYLLTTDALVAFALLNAPAWLSCTPGDWATEELEPEEPPEPEAKEEPKPKPKKRSK